MKLNKSPLFIVFLLMLIAGGSAGQILFPVNNNIIINPPSSTYLTDFTAAGSNRFQVNLTLNDFNEPSYNIRLRFSIEGNGISLITDPNYNAPPINIDAGGNVLYGSEIAGYLNPNNMIINGISPTDLTENGSGLPEGFYTICVEAFDYQRPEVALSQQQCFYPRLRKNYPPNQVFPACGSTPSINLGNPSLQFQWQANTDPMLSVSYELSLAEVVPGISADDAMNGAQTLILDAESVMGTTFTYGPEQLRLEVGKKYAYRIRVVELFGNTTFENNGYSPVCSFYYGYDVDGPVELTSPQDNTSSLNVDDQLNFKWNRPRHALANQAIYYTIKIVKVLDKQSIENAIQFNEAWYEKTTDALPASGVYTLPATVYPLPAEESYAWQVIAYLDASATNSEAVKQQIGKSEIRSFFTAPAVPKIVAGNPSENEKAIDVIGLTKNEDLPSDGGIRIKNISGIGRMIAKENGDTEVLNFTDIKVKWFSDDYWILYEGEINQPLDDFIIPLDNSGEDSDVPEFNGYAEFEANAIIINKDDMYLNGRVKWHYPHPTTEEGLAIVQSVETRVLYNQYKLLDNYINVEENSFDLLDPFGFTIHFHESEGTATNFAVADNALTMTLDGRLTTPKEVQDIENKRVDYSFYEINNPWYFTSSQIAENKDIRLIKNTTIQLDGQDAIFDFSETASPEKITDLDWKGIYFPNFNMILPTDFDGSNQLVLDEEQTYPLELKPENEFIAWVDGGGLQFNYQKEWEGMEGPTAAFNTFRDNFRKLDLRIEDNIVDGESIIKGYVLIPLLDKEKEFGYSIPIGQDGLQVSFLDENLQDQIVIVNEDNEELRIILSIKTAVFENNDRLNISMDMDWESLELEIKNVNNFKIWGDGQIGFFEPGGAMGIPNITGKYKDNYEVTIDSVAAGAKGNEYVFNCIGSIVLGDEASGIGGNAGPPRVQFVSAEERVQSGTIRNGLYWDKKYWSTFEGIKENISLVRLVVFAPIIIRTPTVEANGFVMGIANDPEWGNCFMGVVNGEFKKPTEFGVQLKFLIGKKAETMYWMAEVAATTESLAYNKVDRATEGLEDFAETVSMSKSTNAANQGESTEVQGLIDLGAYQLVEISGRIYHNMSHDLEEECEMDMASMINLGAKKEGESTMNTADFLTNVHNKLEDINLDSVINFMAADKKALLFADLKTNEPNHFLTILNGLPAPDYTLLNDVAGGHNMNWSNYSNVASYAHLFYLFPDVDWPQVLSEIENEEGEPYDWGSHLTKLTLKPDFPDYSKIGKYKQMKVLEELQKLIPADEQFFVDNGFLTQAQWNSLIVQNDGALTYKEFQVTWQIIANKFSEVSYKNSNGVTELIPWESFIMQLINLDWSSIYANLTLQNNESFEIKPFVKKYSPEVWEDIIDDLIGSLGESYSIDGMDANAIMEGLEDPSSFLTPESITDYEIDPNVNFGIMLYVRMRDIATEGEAFLAMGTLEFNILHGGGLGQILLKVDAGTGNAPEADNVDDSFVKMKGCITYTSSTETFIAQMQAQSTKGPFCGQGSLHLKVAPNVFELNLGTRDFPIVVIPGCKGYGATGWFSVNKDNGTTEVGAGIGIVISSINRTPRIGSDVCSIYAYADFYAAMVAYGRIQVQPEFEMLEAGVLFGAGIDVGVNFSGMLCPFGNINVLHLYVGGTLTYEFRPKRLYGAVSGEAVLFSVISADFSFDFDVTL